MGWGGGALGVCAVAGQVGGAREAGLHCIAQCIPLLRPLRLPPQRISPLPDLRIISRSVHPPFDVAPSPVGTQMANLAIRCPCVSYWNQTVSKDAACLGCHRQESWRGAATHWRIMTRIRLRLTRLSLTQLRCEECGTVLRTRCHSGHLPPIYPCRASPQELLAGLKTQGKNAYICGVHKYHSIPNADA